jgi:hypothetical protein
VDYKHKSFMFCVEEWQPMKVQKSRWKRIRNKDLLEIQDKTVMEAHPRNAKHRTDNPQHEQQEINEVLLHSIVTKKIPKDDNPEEEVSKRASKNSGEKTEKGDSSSKGTP